MDKMLSHNICTLSFEMFIFIRIYSHKYIRAASYVTYIIRSNQMVDITEIKPKPLLELDIASAIPARNE